MLVLLMYNVIIIIKKKYIIDHYILFWKFLDAFGNSTWVNNT